MPREVRSNRRRPNLRPSRVGRGNAKPPTRPLPPPQARLRHRLPRASLLHRHPLLLNLLLRPNRRPPPMKSQRPYSRPQRRAGPTRRGRPRKSFDSSRCAMSATAGLRLPRYCASWQEEARGARADPGLPDLPHSNRGLGEEALVQGMRTRAVARLDSRALRLLTLCLGHALCRVCRGRGESRAPLMPPFCWLICGRRARRY